MKPIFTNLPKKITLGLLLLSVGINAQTSLLPSNDTYASQGNSSANYGTGQLLQVMKSSAGTLDNQAFLKFDVATQTQQYTQVLLKLTHVSGPLKSVFLNVLNTTSLNETSLNWSNKPTTIVEAYQGGNLEGSVLYFDVTDYVNKQIAAKGNTYFSLSSKTVTASAQAFASKENSNASFRPQLLLYTTNQKTITKFEKAATTGKVTNDNGDQGFTLPINLPSTVLNRTSGTTETTSQYGGLISCDYKFTATGYFRTELKDGVWYIIDPEGNNFYFAALNSVAEGGGVSLPSAIKKYGINATGSFTDDKFSGFPYCPRLNALVLFKNIRPDVKATYLGDVLPVFESDFASYLMKTMPTWLKDYKNDPWVVGYFTDNELKFSSTQLELSLKLATTNAQFKKADAYMKAKYGSSYKASQVTETDETAYITMVAETYFSAVSAAIRAADPNHMILGSRLNGNVRYRVPVVIAAGKYCDLLSINYYREWEPEDDAMALWAEHTNIPWFVSEFYVKGDVAVGVNSDGAGWGVATQNDRAIFFENWVLKLMTDPNCVGYHWFRYMDNNGSNKGIFNESYVPYGPITASMTKVNQYKYALREQVLNGYQTKTSTANNCGSTLGLNNNFGEENSLFAYPNPTKGILYLSVKSNYKLFSIFGQLLVEANSDKVDLTAFAKGVYILKTDANQALKIIKE